MIGAYVCFSAIHKDGGVRPIKIIPDYAGPLPPIGSRLFFRPLNGPGSYYRVEKISTDLVEGSNSLQIEIVLELEP